MQPFESSAKCEINVTIYKWMNKRKSKKYKREEYWGW